jgi:penicillin amidase
MKTLRIILLSLLALIIAGIIGGSIFIRSLSHSALPDYNEDVALNGIENAVTVFRDSTAMPHIYAESEKDLYLAAGYIMAQDRMWQMDLLRRLTLGRLSEIFGKDLAGADQLFRSLQFSEKSQMVLDSAGAEVLMCLEAYAEGVNRYISDHKGKMPLEFRILGYEPEEWKPIHSANLIGYMAWGLTMPWSMESTLFKLRQVLDDAHFEELVPDMDLQKTYVIPGHPPAGKIAMETLLDDAAKLISEYGLYVFQGSNNWAVSGARTVDGMPLFANDMHLDLNAPGIWYQMHQVVPGKLDVTGVVLPGQPFIVCGHNQDVAWGMTNVMLDDMDFYLETIHPEDSTKYRFNGEWKDLRVKKEVIFTKEGDTVVVYNQFTHRGPVVSKFRKFEKDVISMRWTGNSYSNELISVYKFNRMKNWTEFRDAAKTFLAVSQNIAYADKEGNIGIQTTAGIPLRDGDGIFVVPGDTCRYDWKGIVPFEELPYEFNPSSGRVSSANNRTTGDDYPYYISRWFDLPNRADRIVEELSVDKKLGVEDFQALQANQNSKWAEQLVPYFIAQLEKEIENASENSQKAFELLKNWDYSMPPTSIAATIFEQMYVELLRNIYADELNEDNFRLLLDQDMLVSYMLDRIRKENTSVWFDNVTTTDRVETSPEILLASLVAAVDQLETRFGKDITTWQWGKVHTLTLKHPLGTVALLNKAFGLNKGPFPVGGSYHTVSPYSYPLTNLAEANHGSSHRHIYCPGDWDKSLVILPTGISGMPGSRYYCSMTEDYVAYRYKRDYFSKAMVEASAAWKMQVVPK